MPETGVVKAAKINPCRHRDTDSVNNHSVIGHREGFKRILDWHADAEGTKAYVSARDFEWVGPKRNGRQGCIEK
jgi:hypothetical protein